MAINGPKYIPPNSLSLTRKEAKRPLLPSLIFLFLLFAFVFRLLSLLFQSVLFELVQALLYVLPTLRTDSHTGHPTTLAQVVGGEGGNTMNRAFSNKVFGKHGTSGLSLVWAVYYIKYGTCKGAMLGPLT